MRICQLLRLVCLFAGLATVAAACAPAATQPPALLPPENPPAGAVSEFSTDFTIHSIPYSEVFSGGPPKDGIPALDNPRFVSVSEADEWLGDLEPVTVFQEQGDVRVYPLQILIWHEIVNDVVGGRPVVITFCPLCNTAIVFDATISGRPLDFGTTGRLRFSNLLMYDRQTESWWQQAGGDAVIGELTGARLTFLPAAITSWDEVRNRHPDAQVLSRDTGHRLDYGRNPYPGYDDVNSSPFLFRGDTPDQLPAMARVTTVELNGEAAAYPNTVLQEIGVVNDAVGGVEVVVFWQPGLASALDSDSISEGQDVGANGVFERTLNGQTLSFTMSGAGITDDQTGSTWNILGEATGGSLVGQALAPVVKVDHFWFSWAAFRPDTRIYQQP
ncbi:MAG: DUF3179 domain-containing protein [bacterium]